MAAVGLAYNVYGIIFVTFVAFSMAACVQVGHAPDHPTSTLPDGQQTGAPGPTAPWHYPVFSGGQPPSPALSMTLSVMVLGTTPPTPNSEKP